MNECWDIDNMELMQDDCLTFLKLLFIDIYLHRYTKLCSYIILLLHVPVWAVQFYYQLKMFNIHLVVQYVPCSLAFLYAFVSAIIPILFEDDLRYSLVIRDETFWSMRCCSDKLQEQIKRESTYIFYILIGNIILCVATYFLLLMRARAGKEWEIIYQVTFFKEHFPEHAHILIIIFYVSISYFIIPMLLAVYILVYYTLHSHFQSQMLVERICKITENFQEDIQLVHHHNYQIEVYERLRFCAIRMAQLKRNCSILLMLIAQLVVLYITLGILLVVCYLGSYYFDPDKYYPLIGMISIVTGYSGFLIAETGQICESESLQVYYKLQALPWYNFNVKIQKMILFLLMHCNEPMVICPYKSFPVNRRLIVQFYKIFSSVSALLANTREKVL